MLVASPILTAIHFQGAPPFYPWEAITGDHRFLIMVAGDHPPDQIGHSPILWVVAFLAAFVLQDIYFAKRPKMVRFFMLIPLVAILLLTKTRIALLYLFLLGLAILAYKHILRSRVFLAAIPVLIVLLYFATSVIVPLKQPVFTLTAELQKQWPSLRIQGEGTDAFTGRDILNRALLSASMERPWTGLGHSAPLLQFGVRADGSTNFGSNGEKSISSIESGLRMAVKYGWPYFAAQLLFMVWPLVMALRNRYRDNIFVITVTGMILVSVCTEGGMELFYDISALFLLLLLTFHLEAFNAAYHFSSPALWRARSIGLPRALTGDRAKAES
jgi:hypothetical protein